MSANNFVFPPPPPPPPKSAVTGGHLSSTTFSNTSGRGNIQHRGRDNHHRGASQGRGTGYGYRGFAAKDYSTTGLGHNSVQLGGVQHGMNRGDSFTDLHPSSQFNGRGAWSGYTRGQKRKRDDAVSHGYSNFRGRTEVAPAVPSFGSVPLLPTVTKPTPNPAHSLINTQPAKSVTPKVRGLGLVPYDDDSSDSAGDEGEDHNHASNTNPLQFEFNGQTTNLNSAEAMKSWLAERRKNWPTASRTAARKQESLKKQQELLRKKLLADQTKKKNDLAEQAKKSELSKSDSVGSKTKKDLVSVSGGKVKLSKEEKARKSLEKYLAKAEALKQQLAGSESTKPPAGPKEDGESPDKIHTSLAGVEQESPKQLIADKEEVEIIHGSSSDSSSISSTSESDTCSESDVSESSDESDMEKEAEILTGKGVDEISNKSETTAKPRICRVFAAGGRCKFGSKCRFKHERPEGPNPSQGKRRAIGTATKRKTLHQRLVDQEREVENRQTLEVIRYLGDNGYLDENSR